MKLAIDTTFFGHSEISNNHLSLSTSIFTADILDVWKKSSFAKDITLLVNYNHYSFFKKNYPEFIIKPLKFFPLSILNKLSKGRFKGTKLLKKLGIFQKTVNKGNFDLLWIPYCVDYTYVKTSVPTVCTIHDIYPVHKKGFTGWDFVTDSFTVLTSVSDYTKQDILKTFSIEKEITKIPNSIVFDVSKRKEISSLVENGSAKKYILDLNAYIFKKNPMTLLKAFNKIKDKTDCTLVFCGGYKEQECYEEIQNFITKNNLSSRVQTLFRISDEERNWLLTNASLFVTPSLFEGFGRTPVEAAICNIPVISTKETSLHEATMGLCSYVNDSKDSEELASLILEKINNPDSKQKLKGISSALTNNYNPEVLAEKYTQLFSNICN